MNNPKDDLEQAREIALILEKNILQANWYSALYERVAFKEDIGNAFGISFEALGLEKCSDALLDSLIMTLMRIIHGVGENTASLQTLLESLKKSGVFGLLEKELKSHGRNIPCGLNQLEQKITSIKGDSKLANINSCRNTNLAHLAIKPNTKKHRPTKYEDPPEFLKKSDRLLSYVSIFYRTLLLILTVVQASILNLKWLKKPPMNFGNMLPILEAN